MAIEKKDVNIFVLTDIGKIEPKIIMGLTKRQILSVFAAGAVGVPVFIICSMYKLPSAVSLFLMMTSMIPVFFGFFFNVHGRYFRKLMQDKWRRFRRPGVRVPRTENKYRIAADKKYEREVLGIGTVQKKKSSGKTDKRKAAAGKAKKQSKL